MIRPWRGRFFPAAASLALLLLRAEDHVWIRRLAMTIATVEFLFSLLLIPKVQIGVAGYQLEEFAKWINPEDARLKGIPEKEYAQQMADKWRQGLADWGQTPERIKLLKDAADATSIVLGAQPLPKRPPVKRTTSDPAPRGARRS